MFFALLDAITDISAEPDDELNLPTSNDWSRSSFHFDSCCAGLTSKATKMPNWTSFLNDNGTTSQLPLPVQNKSSASSHNLGVSALPQSGSALTQTQNSPSSSSSSAQRVEASAGSQQAAKATPADPTQSQANIMLSQAGLPKHTADMQGSDLPQELGLVQVSPAMEDGATQPRQAQTNSSMSLGSSSGSTETTLSGTDLSRTELGQSQAGLSQSLGLPEDVVQSSQTGVRSMSEGLPDDWDWESYLQLNPDVAAAVGNDPESAGLHWREWGELEKRPYKVDCFLFDLIFNSIISLKPVMFLPPVSKLRRHPPPAPPPALPPAKISPPRLDLKGVHALHSCSACGAETRMWCGNSAATPPRPPPPRAPSRKNQPALFGFERRTCFTQLYTAAVHVVRKHEQVHSHEILSVGR